MFDGAFDVIETRIVGEKHLKFKVRAVPTGASEVASGAAFDAIAFGYVGGVAEDSAVRAGARVELAYRLEINEYDGTERVQLRCEHLRAL